MAAEDPRHLFVTGIPADAKFSEALAAFEAFGRIQSLTFLSPKDGPHSGRAFLSFHEPDSGAKCLAQSRQSRALVSEKALAGNAVAVRGEPVVVRVKKSREELLSRTEPKDKRNLHLMYEGHITPDMDAAQGVPDSEMQKRKRLWDLKQERLVDTNNKVSRTRLAVFNLPRTAGTGQIRKIFAIAPKKYARTHRAEAFAQLVEAQPVRITEVRKVDGQDDVAFLQFTRHEHALAALRHVNNNPAYFHDRRLIVEFALENSFTMKSRRKKEHDRKKMRTKRFAAHEPPTRTEPDDDDDE
jgi:nucleolar protein 4